jgi:hypothetical protein
MAPRGKTFLTVFASASLALGLLLAIAAITVYQYGILRIQVRSGGDNIHVICPGFIVPAAMRFVPDRAFSRVSKELDRMPPEIRSCLRELEKAPDCVLVEVKSARENVKIAKRRHMLVIDVNSPDETVHLSLPLKALDSVIGRVQTAALKNECGPARDRDPACPSEPPTRRANVPI